jgi:hypothetical protein
MICVEGVHAGKIDSLPYFCSKWNAIKDIFVIEPLTRRCSWLNLEKHDLGLHYSIQIQSSELVVRYDPLNMACQSTSLCPVL